MLVPSLLCLVAAGCSSSRFYAGYHLDPMPVRINYSDLEPVAERQPVYLVFDMYSAEGSFPEATSKLAPKVVRFVQNSRLFSEVSKFGSANMARLEVSMQEKAVLSEEGVMRMPAGLSGGLQGSRGAIVYEFTLAYQRPDAEPVMKVYPHAVHLVEGESFPLADDTPLTASHAVDAMIEQVVLTFLRDLQRSGKL